MLTRKQHELLLYIHKCIQEAGVSPSFDEMKDALNLKSKSGIHRLITALEERGFIARLAHRARALEVLKLPGAAVPGGRKLSPNVIVGEFANAAARTTPDTGETVSLPLYGRIAAGAPIEALSDPNSFIDIPIAMIDRGEHFALEVSGDSMIEAGILDGDTAIIQRSETADNGAVVVALVDGEEATLKRLRRKGDSVALEPANKNYETRIFPPGRVRIQGRLVAILRRY
jgi:repressor LexA